MSLPPADEEQSAKARRSRRPFETWRKLALTGALILFGGSVLAATDDSLPHVATFLLAGTGWGFLAAGFGRAMLDRRRRSGNDRA